MHSILLLLLFSLKTREGAVKQDQDRGDELVRSAMRAVRAIQEIDGIDSCVRFRQMVNK